MRDQRFQIGEYWLSQRGKIYYATRFNPKTRQTDRTSLRCTDFEEAKEKLAAYVTLFGTMKKESKDDVPISKLFARYYEHHAKAIRSADVTLRALNKWIDYYNDATVAELTPERQRGFIADLRSHNLSDGYIKRTITAGKAALNYAYKNQEIDSVPYIMSVPDSEPADRVITMRETAKLFNAVKPGDKDFMYLMIAYNTLARPEAILDLAPSQIDLNDRLINLLVPGTKQTKKRRPTLPITNTLLPWLQACDGETFVNYHGRKIANNKKAFGKLCERAHVRGITRKTIRHTMATEMRRRGVDIWEVEGWLGHRLPSTSERYAKYAPDYLSQGTKAIDDYFNELQKLVSYPIKIAVYEQKENKA